LTLPKHLQIGITGVLRTLLPKTSNPNYHELKPLKNLYKLKIIFKKVTCDWGSAVFQQ